MIRSKIAMGFLWALLAFALHVWPGAVNPAHAQGTRKDDIVFNSRGIPLAGATVRVCAMPASGQPCTPLALIYSDPALTQALANPTTTDGLGNYFFYAAPGKYEIEISGPGITTKQIPNVILPNDPASPNFSAVSAFSLSLSGNLTVSGNTTVVGNLASGTLNLANQSTPPGSAGSGTVNLYTKTTDKRLYYKDETGTETGPLLPGAATNITNTFTAPQNFNADLQFKGPTPWTDVRAYGVRAVNSGAAPAVPGITASITSGQTAATLSSASSFQNGDGVVIFGAGAAHSMSTPGAPTVTPSVAANLTGTGVVANAPAGSTTYNYQIVARNTAGGLTAASAVGSTSAGSSSLGSQSVTISTLTRTDTAGGLGSSVAVVTSSAHGLSVGSMVYIFNTSSGPNFDGWFLVTAVPDNTHFTYLSNLQIALGALASGTSGTAVSWNCNHITWSAVSGAYQYYIYGRTGGSLTLLGVSLPTTSSSSMLYWDDFGSPMMDNFVAPYFVPTTPPSSATSNNLVTTISSGAGTTSLTLANSAGTTVTNATILFDNAPNIKTAYNNSGAILFPVSSNGIYVTNSYLDLGNGGSGQAVYISGTLYLNDSLKAGGRWYGNVLPPQASPGQFAWEGLPLIEAGRANPGFVMDVANSSALRGLQFTANVSNNGIPFYYDGTNASGLTIENCTFTSAASSGAADYMGVALWKKGGFSDVLRHVMIAGGIPTAGNGSTATPAFILGVPSGGQGSFKMEEWSGSGRGIFFSPGSGGVVNTIRFGRIQGGVTPILTIAAPSGGLWGGVVNFDYYEEDTIPHPLVANLPIGGGGFSGTLNIVGSNGPSSDSAGPPPLVTGNPVLGSISLLAAFSSSMAINNLTVPTGSFGDTKVTVVGPGTLGSRMPVGAAPSVTTTSGTKAAGTYVYALVPKDVNGNFGPPFLPTASCTVNGSQACVISFALVPGQVTTNLCESINGGQFGCESVGNGANFTGTAFTDNEQNFNFNNSYPPGGGGDSADIDKNGVQAPQLTLTGGGWKSTVSGTFTANRTQTLPDFTGIVPVSGYVNSAYDNFHRANGPLGTNWTSAIGTLQISNNVAIATALTGGNASAIWANGGSFSPNQFAQTTITFLNGATDLLGPAVRYSTAGSGYTCIESTTTLALQRDDANNRTTLQTSSITGNVGDVLRIEANGSTITCTQSNSSGTVSISSTDSTYAAGSPAIFQFGTVATQGNWSGGNLHPLAHLDAEQDWTRPQHFTQGVAFGLETVSSSPRGVQSTFLPGALTSTWTGSTWTLDKAISVTRVQVQVKTAPSGCTTNASLRLTDGTSPVNLTVSAAANDSGPITQNYAAGASLTIAVQTAAAGCTTSPADANVIVQYRMQ